ncbi:hypothetical protein TW85_21940 [Marinomonas sp. S3726]|nr:hypothetical protein TW85_21940 [Marinomonas sp. S3726]
MVWAVDFIGLRGVYLKVDGGMVAVESIKIKSVQTIFEQKKPPEGGLIFYKLNFKKSYIDTNNLC